ncbi:glycosyltransferase family 32 protein [Rhizobacter sp. P5_C2]
MIPTVFHQIWIHRDRPELPAEFAALRDSWLRLHPGWRYRLWNLGNLDFAPRRPELIAQCSSYAQMADVLRLEILLAHGGVYLDTDFECFRPIDALVAPARVFACSENGSAISTGILGAEPGAALVERLLMSLPARIGRAMPNQETGPGHVTRELLRGGFDGTLTLFPTPFFYPYASGEPRATAQSHPQAYAAHHWAHSWAQPEDRNRWLRLRRRVLSALGLQPPRRQPG